MNDSEKLDAISYLNMQIEELNCIISMLEHDLSFIGDNVVKNFAKNRLEQLSKERVRNMEIRKTIIFNKINLL